MHLYTQFIQIEPFIFTYSQVTRIALCVNVQCWACLGQIGRVGLQLLIWGLGGKLAYQKKENYKCAIELTFHFMRSLGLIFCNQSLKRRSNIECHPHPPPPSLFLYRWYLVLLIIFYYYTTGTETTVVVPVTLYIRNHGVYSMQIFERAVSVYYSKLSTYSRGTVQVLVLAFRQYIY